jgi:hypothetical protein
MSLKRIGYQSMLDVYFELNPSFCEPPHTRPVLAFFFKKSRGVRGASCYETGGTVYSDYQLAFCPLSLLLD